MVASSYPDARGFEHAREGRQPILNHKEAKAMVINTVRDLLPRRSRPFPGLRTTSRPLPFLYVLLLAAVGCQGNAFIEGDSVWFGKVDVSDGLLEELEREAWPLDFDPIAREIVAGTPEGLVRTPGFLAEAGSSVDRFFVQLGGDDLLLVGLVAQCLEAGAQSFCDCDIGGLPTDNATVNALTQPVAERLAAIGLLIRAEGLKVVYGTYYLMPPQPQGCTINRNDPVCPSRPLEQRDVDVLNIYISALNQKIRYFIDSQGDPENVKLADEETVPILATDMADCIHLNDSGDNKLIFLWTAHLGD